MLRWWILNTFFKKELLEIDNNYQGALRTNEINANKKAITIELVHSILKKRIMLLLEKTLTK